MTRILIATALAYLPWTATPQVDHPPGPSSSDSMVVSTELAAAEVMDVTEPELVIRTAVGELRRAAADERKRAFAADTLNDILQTRLNTRLVSKIVLGKHWSEASEYQRAEFERLFIRFVASIFAGEGLLDAFLPENGTSISFGKTTVKGNRALVRMNVHDSENTYQIGFMMHDDGEAWKVIDIRMESLSIIATKRSEFAPHLSEHGIAPVIDYLRRAEHEF